MTWYLLVSIYSYLNLSTGREAVFACEKFVSEVC